MTNTSTPTAKKYRATFIVDTRGHEESPDELVQLLKEEVTKAGGQVYREENLGNKAFARTPDARRAAGWYIQLYFDGTPGTPRTLKSNLRLNTAVSHILLEKTDS